MSANKVCLSNCVMSAEIIFEIPTKSASLKFAAMISNEIIRADTPSPRKVK